MKKYLASVLLILTAAAVVAAPQTFTAPAKAKGKTKTAIKKKTPPPLQREDTRGVLVRAFAHGNNPIQMLNPKAPAAQYGTSVQHVALDPYTGKPMGIKLFEVVF